MSLHRATQNFAYGTKQGEKFLHGGTVLDGNDPIVKAFPDLFELVVEIVPEPPTPTRRQRNG